MKHFSPNSDEDQKKVLYQKWNTFLTFFLSTDLHSDAHQRQIIGGDADEDHTQIVGGIQSNYWGDITLPSSSCFGTTDFGPK